jgi:glycosyltransferase involved in cell wall biosynthesis
LSNAPHIAVNAQLLSPEPGYRQAGVSRYISELLHGMWQMSPEVRWTVYCPRGVAAHSFPGPPPASVHLRTSLRSRTRRPAVRIGWEQAVLPWLLKRDRPDVLLAPLNVVPLFAPCPTVVVVHDLAFLRLRTHGAGRRNYQTHMTRLSVQRAIHVVTVSEFTRLEVLDLFDVPEAKVTAIPNGLGSQFRPRSADEMATFRQRAGLPEQYLLYVGTIEPRKNLAGLFRAYAAVREQLNVPLVVVGGKGWMVDPIFNVVHSLGLEPHVRFEGFVADEDLSLYYGAATALVYPSLYEGFGLPPLEAMASGTPVITSRGSSLSEVVGDAAILVEPGDDVSLANAMVRVLGDRSLRERLSVAGREQASSFSWKRTAATTLDVLLHQSAGPHRPIHAVPLGHESHAAPTVN